MLLLSDIPGVVVKSTLTPGAEVGSSDLIVDLTPGRRVTGSVEADNAGNRYTGEYRFGGTVNVNNPLGAGDMLSLRVLASTASLVYLRGAYQAPLGDLTVGTAYSHIHYRLGSEFKALNADGTADVASVYASYPLIRTRRENLYAVAAFDAKKFEDRVRSVGTRSNRQSRVFSGGFNSDSRDGLGGGGANSASVIYSHGTLDILTPADHAIDAVTARSQGDFDKISYSAARIQTLSGPLSLYASVRGQIAFGNLDSSEKMELGGAYGVRAYPEGEAYGDEGYIATVEARLTLNQTQDARSGRFQIIGFVDVGAVEFAKHPWFVGPNVSRRSGIGAGVTWAGPERLLITASYAHKLGSQKATSAPDEPGRAWFQIVKLF